jgi:hypothetical protein
VSAVELPQRLPPPPACYTALHTPCTHHLPLLLLLLLLLLLPRECVVPIPHLRKQRNRMITMWGPHGGCSGGIELQVKVTMLSPADPARCAGPTVGGVCANAAAYILRALVGLRCLATSASRTTPAGSCPMPGCTMPAHMPTRLAPCVCSSGDSRSLCHLGRDVHPFPGECCTAGREDASKAAAPGQSRAPA